MTEYYLNDIHWTLRGIQSELTGFHWKMFMGLCAFMVMSFWRNMELSSIGNNLNAICKRLEIIDLQKEKK